MAQSGHVRIIGGKWRGRNLKVLDYPSLRPTPDRVRETLFNWLGQDIVDAECLDLFAGTGVLGFEALSRGAKHVTLVEKYAPAVTTLMQIAGILQCAPDCEIVRASAMSWLADSRRVKPYDVIFLDPPFASPLLEQAVEFLAQSPLVNESTLLYLESPKPLEEKHIPGHWTLLKQKIAGEVAYHLARGGVA